MADPKKYKFQDTRSVRMSDDLIKELDLYKSITKEDLLTNKLSPLNYRKKGNELAIKEEFKKLKTKKEQYKFILDNLELGNWNDGYFKADYQFKLLRKIQIEEPWLHEEYISGLNEKEKKIYNSNLSNVKASYEAEDHEGKAPTPRFIQDVTLPTLSIIPVNNEEKTLHMNPPKGFEPTEISREQKNSYEIKNRIFPNTIENLNYGTLPNTSPPDIKIYRDTMVGDKFVTNMGLFTQKELNAMGKSVYGEKIEPSPIEKFTSNLEDYKQKAKGPQKGSYFKRLGPKGEEEGKWATTYYRDKDDNIILFSSLEELNNHISENHPELKDIGDSEDIANLDAARKKQLGIDNWFTAFPDYAFDDPNLSTLDRLYDDTKNTQYKEGGPKVGEYFKRYGPEGEEEGKWATTYYKGADGKYKLFGSQEELDKHILDRGNKEVQIKAYTSPYFDTDETNLLDSLYDQEKERQRTAYTPDTPPPSDVDKDKKMGEELGSVVTALKAGAGIIGLGKAMKDIPIGENQELSDSFKAYMQKSKELSESGLTASEKASIRNDLSNAYTLGAKNVLRASGGNRGTFLSNMGMLNTNRVNALIKMGEIDAKMQRQNMEAYGKMLTFQEKFKAEQGAIGREMAYKESLRKSNLYGGLGSSLIGSAISDLTYAEQMKQMEPYMNEWARNMGLTTTATNTGSDADDDAALFVNTEN